MSEDDALGSARRTRGVHDAGDVVASGKVGLGWVSLTLLPELLDGEELALAGGKHFVDGLDVLIIGLAVINDVLDRLSLADHFGKRAEQFCVGEDTNDIGFGERVLETFLAKGLVGSAEGNALTETGVSHVLPIDAARIKSSKGYRRRMWSVHCTPFEGRSSVWGSNAAMQLPEPLDESAKDG